MPFNKSKQILPDGVLINVRDLSFSYSLAPILTNVNFSIFRNESVCIVGPNGGGKSTLLRIILGLIRPQQGTVSVLDERPEKACRRIGYMPQHLTFDRAFPVSSMDVVLMGRAGLSLTGFYSKKDHKIAMEALEEMGVADIAKRNLSELSGGQRQRVLIARALACKPELLILDEPTANVDPVAEHQIGVILKELTNRITVITVSHDLGFVSQLVDRVLCVNKVVKVHPTSEITGEIIKDIYGGEIKMVRHDHCYPEPGQQL